MTLAGTLRSMSVSMNPGATALAVMPLGPSSRAHARVIPMIPPLLAA